MDYAWIQDISGALTMPVLIQYLQLRRRLEEVVLQIGVQE
jgi:hypothetical protein